MSKFDLIPTSCVGVMTCVLVLLVENKIGILVNEFLHGVLYKFIEGVELLSDETLLVEETRNDGPTVLLRYCCPIIVFLLLLILISIVWVIVIRILSVASNKIVQDHISAKKAHNRYLDSWFRIPTTRRRATQQYASRGLLKSLKRVQ